MIAVPPRRVGFSPFAAAARWTERTGSPPYFRAAVAFYPGCVDSLRAAGVYAVAAPLTLFIAGSDDWTAPKPCIDLAERLIAVKASVTFSGYPDTYHGFDGPPSQGRLHLDVPNGVKPGAGVTVAPNPAARDDPTRSSRSSCRRSSGRVRAYAPIREPCSRPSGQQHGERVDLIGCQFFRKPEDKPPWKVRLDRASERECARWSPPRRSPAARSSCPPQRQRNRSRPTSSS